VSKTWHAKQEIACVQCGDMFLPRRNNHKYCSTRCIILYHTRRVGDCLEWTLARSKDGYGTYRLTNKSISVHRALWQIEYGEIPEGLCVCHTCDNPSCVNLDHLFLGTRSDNMQDAVRKGRWAKVSGELNPRARLTEDAVREIRASDGIFGSNIRFAHRFGVAVVTVEKVRCGATWKHVI